jgi:glycosyltransferase involved in cell wall biosynthesis
MKIIIDMQAIQEKGLADDHSMRSLDYLLDLVGNSDPHELRLVLSDLYPLTVEPIRAAFHGALPQENIEIWQSPPDAGEPWHNDVARQIRAHFLASLCPDIIHLAGDPRSRAALEILDMGDVLSCIPFSAELQKPETDLSPCPVTRQAALLVNVDDAPGSPAIHAFDKWFSDRKPAGKKTTGPRPRLACISPLPPEPSGISTYTAELLPYLADYYDIDVIVDQKQVTDPWINANCPIRSVEWFRRNHDQYDRVLYHFGNSPFHWHMFGLLDLIPGTVVLHEIYLSDVVGYLDSKSREPGLFARELYLAHDYRPLQKLMQGESMAEIVRGYPCSYSVIRNAEGVIVHSAHARELAGRWYGHRAYDHMEVIPHLRVPSGPSRRNEARRALGVSDETFLVCCFGHIGQFKLNHRLVESWLASDLDRDRSCMLIFVGKNDSGRYGQEFQRAISGKSRVKITGWVDDADYHRWLEAADLSVQLRDHSRGESSGAVLDCMNQGLAVIVNAHGSMAEFDPETLCMLPDQFSEQELRQALETLYHDGDARRSYGCRAQAHIRKSNDPLEIAGLYAGAIERFASAPVRRRTDAVRAIASHASLSGNLAVFESIAEVIAETFPPPVRKKQLLIDISAVAKTDLKTGIQRVVRSIVKNLIDDPPQGYRVEPVYACPDRPYRYARQRTLELLGCSSSSPIADDLVETYPGDILFIPDLHFQVVKSKQQFFMAMRRKGAKVVFLVHDLLPVKFPDYFPDDAGPEFGGYLDVIASSADAAIGVTGTVAGELHEWIASRRHHRYRPLSIGWNHHGADIEASIPSKGLPPGFESILRKLSVGQTILMVGTVEPRKGHAQALQAMEILWAEGYAVNLAIVGKSGWMIEELSRRLEHHGERNKRLFWFQGISDEALLRLYAESDGVLMASEGEGFGLPLIEAAQHGLPVLARDIPVFREIGGDHVSYFSGTAGAELALFLKQWMADVKQGTAPDSTSMPWMSWEQSSRCLAAMLTDRGHPNWVYPG